MPIISKITKPEIRLIGNIITNRGSDTSFSEIIDHSPTLSVANDIIGSSAAFDSSQILAFNSFVRIIITSQVEPKFTYLKKHGPTEFEGNVSYNTSASSAINQYSETFYTLNGKDPVRSSNYLYNFLDYDDYTPLTTKDKRYDPSADPSVFEDKTTIITEDNTDDLGFLLKTSLTGTDMITLKTRTFFRGQKSDVTIARFKIYRDNVSNTKVIDNSSNNQ